MDYILDSSEFTRSERRLIHSLFYSVWEKYSIQNRIVEKWRLDNEKKEVLDIQEWYLKIYSNRAFVLSRVTDTKLTWCSYTEEKYPMIGVDVNTIDFLDIIDDFINSKKTSKEFFTKSSRRIKKSDTEEVRWSLSINRSTARDIQKEIDLLEKIFEKIKVQFQDIYK